MYVALDRSPEALPGIYWPVSGDISTVLAEPFTPSAGNLWSAPGVAQNIGVVNSPNYTRRISLAYRTASHNEGVALDSVHEWSIYTGDDFRDTTFAPTRIEANKYARARFGSEAYVENF